MQKKFVFLLQRFALVVQEREYIRFRGFHLVFLFNNAQWLDKLKHSQRSSVVSRDRKHVCWKMTMSSRFGTCVAVLHDLCKAQAVLTWARQHHSTLQDKTGTVQEGSIQLACWVGLVSPCTVARYFFCQFHSLFKQQSLGCLCSTYLKQRSRDLLFAGLNGFLPG